MVHFKNFLSPKEVDHLIQLAESGFTRSEVVSDSQAVSQSRTSYGTWLNGARRTEAVYKIQNRIAQVTGIPEAFGESLYVLRYEKGQKYEMHTDHCRSNTGENEKEILTPSCKEFLKRAGGPQCGLEGGGQTCGDRLATFIIYLKTPERGGETVFPRAVLQKNQTSPAAPSMLKDMEFTHSPPQNRSRSLIGDDNDIYGDLDKAETSGVGIKNDKMNDADGGDSDGDDLRSLPWYCRKESEDQVLKVLPQPGDGIFFFNYVPPGTTTNTNKIDFDVDLDYFNELAVPDPTSAHSGCPPIQGTKMIATRWMRSSQFG